MPESVSKWRSKSPQYLSHVFGHEGPNSLFSQLVKDGYATWLSAGSTEKLNQSFEQFAIDIGPTEKGEKEMQKLIKIIYMFINKIKAEGVQGYIYDELRYKSLIDFANLSKQDALSTATSLARRAKFIQNEDDIRHILQKPFIFEALDQDDIMARLNLMVPQNMYVISHSPAHKMEKEDQPEKF